MKRLLLLRHAKAVVGSAKSGDHGRTLNDRGRFDAPRMGIAMQHKGYIPDRILCSTAKRTVETWKNVAPELGPVPDPEFLDALYLAPGKAILAIVRALEGASAAVLVIGHNPGLEECAHALARKPRSEEERRRRDSLTTKFPTCALAVFDFAADAWSELAAGTGELVDFIKPKELIDE